MFGKLLDTASLLKAKIAKDELDQALIEATNDDNWQASTTVLHEIASSAYNHEKWKRISEFVWQRLRNNARWKKILKAMNIVEFLLKNGPGFAVDQLRRDLHFFRTLESFQAYEENIDRGAPIRERAKAIVSLLTNEDLLEDERVRARQIRERMSHLSGTANAPSGGPQGNIGPKYESYNNQTFGRNNDSNAFYNYGHGNYGDREYDRNHRDDYFQHLSRKIDSPKKEHKEPLKETKKQAVEQVKLKPIEPIVNLNAGRKQEKGSYETMAQRLMRSKPARVDTVSNKPEQTTPVIPDLSYKKKDAGDLLIDTQAHFIQSRYHFQTPAVKQTQSQPQPEKVYTPVVETQVPAYIPNPPTNTTALTNNTYNPPQVPTVSPSPNLLSEMDGLLFLGVQPSEKAIVQTMPQNTQPQGPPSVPQTPNIQQASLNTVAPNYAPQPIAQSQQPPPQFQPTIQPLPIISQPQIPNSFGYPPATYPQGIQYPPNPSYAVNYGGYYSPQAPIYQQPTYNPYNPYPQNGFPMNNPNPYAPLPPQQFYPQPAYQPLQPQYTYQQPSVQQNPYSPPPILPDNISFSTVASQPSVPASNSKSNKNEDQFGDFKNGGSFEIQKIDWLSNKQKNLTDLTDFSIDPKDRRKPQKKKDFGNNIKIDPWAW